MKPKTQAAAALGWVAPPFKAIVPPLHPATTFERAVDGSYPGGRQYSRADSPAYDQPEAVLAELEKGADALLFSSGMAAATAVFQALTPGATVLAPQVMYWGLRRWLEGPACDWGLQVHSYPNGDLDALERLCAAHPPDLLWIETPANPTWEIQDIAASVVLAKRSGAIVVADSTVATPVHTQPLSLGADIVMHSATKYLNGHSDVVAGALITAEPRRSGSGLSLCGRNTGRCWGRSKPGYCCAGCAPCFCAYRRLPPPLLAWRNGLPRIRRWQQYCIPACQAIPAMPWPVDKCRLDSAACCHCVCKRVNQPYSRYWDGYACSNRRLRSVQ